MFWSCLPTVGRTGPPILVLQEASLRIVVLFSSLFPSLEVVCQLLEYLHVIHNIP